ncbi:hypothetical protein ACFY64_29190 [Streptomyces collinus]|uniref:hypothetical protein n=1 Tax=Streptomyces collinus TaxID=42684 RepID=UPI00369522FF
MTSPRGNEGTGSIGRRPVHCPASQAPATTVRPAEQAVPESFEGPLAAGLRAERRPAAVNTTTRDHVEGMHAFLDKREPTSTHV